VVHIVRERHLFQQLRPGALNPILVVVEVRVDFPIILDRVGSLLCNDHGGLRGFLVTYICFEF
jgi:hypothetical protein